MNIRFPRYIFIFLLPLFFSCYHENKVDAKVPEHLLSKSEMVSVLTDVQIAEGALTYRRTRRIEQQGFREAAYDKIFSNYGITAKILNENINYYNNDPGQMEEIYEQVLAKLSRMAGEIKEEASHADTIKPAH
jgi:transposase